MTEVLPIPLVPPECDLRNFGFIPLEFRRLFTSETWLLGKPEEKLAALALWCESWHQVPAASLPDNDRVLAHLSQAGTRWPKMRDHALRGWVRCSDGRLYHPVVAEKAIEAWKGKLEQRARTHAARVAAIRKKIEKATTDEERRLLQEQLQALLADVTGSKGQGEGKGKGYGEGQGQKSKPQTLSDAARRAAAETWQAYSAAYRQRYGVEPLRNAKVNGMLAHFVGRVPHDEAPAVAAFYVGHNKQLYNSARHCVDLLLRDAEGLRTEWATGSKVTETSARQADRTATTGDQVERLLAESRRTA
jgi:hypothetical protein